ncbi:hypothetical protein VitviT2T_010207 [Vitis vinifera]|uniref:Uncharacterized protein n=1 Tax=Vitis vinifera TaxID=29760 RepID=A0ABY9C8K8_VITVI|nr:hypothetical protein VitviT2T_010207 [Vitis vinifera]
MVGFAFVAGIGTVGEYCDNVSVGGEVLDEVSSGIMDGVATVSGNIMRFYLRSQGLWNVVMFEADPPPLGANPTVAQMKAHEEEKLKKDTSPSYIQDLQTTSSPKSWTWKHINRLMDVVNQMRFLGEAFIDQKVVEKIMVSVPQKFEAKISAIEESCDLQSLTIAELTSKPHAQEQRVLMRGDEATKGVFQANHKEKSSGNL